MLICVYVLVCTHVWEGAWEDQKKPLYLLELGLKVTSVSGRPDLGVCIQTLLFLNEQ